ncbi:tripartite tricarboxylate transporter TctB family protein [Allorhizocola rhizosphaerae]|uniref:tripartite tricarboxylate transporter TctB family protein n=1 Tax=Allorhizocola rhizosphaerae TaxID=1872709 RepID=UPI0013C3443F|nr:tripartite tricarboxylate transporter TctB family protein [Allorhizocola rhizosphaerae]
MGVRIAGAVVLAVGIGLFVQALTGANGSGASYAPLLITGMWVVVATLYLVKHSGPLQVRWRTPLLLLGVLVAYAVVLKYTVVGYVLATFVFFVVAARLMSTKPHWIRDLSVAIGLSLGIYLVFTKLLGISLPAGVLPI